MSPSMAPTAVPCGMSWASLLSTLRGLLAGGAAVGLLAAGCGSSHPRSTASTSSSTMTDPVAAAVLAASRAEQQAFGMAFVTADPSLPALAVTMTDPQLQLVKRNLVAEHQNGYVGSGSVTLHPHLVALNGTQAVVEDCLYSSQELVYGSTGKPVPPVTPPQHDGVRSVLTEVEPGQWKVGQQTVTEGHCPAGY